MQQKITKLTSLAIVGLLFILVGSVLLLKTTGFIKQIEILWPLLSILSGIIVLYFVFLRGVAPRYSIVGIFFTLSGIVYLLLVTIFHERELEQIWPVFMCIVGISITLYGFLKKAATRRLFLVPGITLIIISLIFLPFSLQLIEKSLLTFVVVWWPLFLIIIGVDMIVAFFIRRNQRKRS